MDSLELSGLRLHQAPTRRCAADSASSEHRYGTHSQPAKAPAVLELSHDNVAVLVQNHEKEFGHHTPVRRYLERAAATTQTGGAKKRSDNLGMHHIQERMAFKALMRPFRAMIKRKEDLHPYLLAGKATNDDVESAALPFDQLLDIYEPSFRLFMLARNIEERDDIEDRVKPHIKFLAIQAFGNFRIQLGQRRLNDVRSAIARRGIAAVRSLEPESGTESSIKAHDALPLLMQLVEKAETCESMAIVQEASKLASVLEREIFVNNDPDMLTMFGTTTYYLSRIEGALLRSLSRNESKAAPFNDEWLPSSSSSSTRTNPRAKLPRRAKTEKAAQPKRVFDPEKDTLVQNLDKEPALDRTGAPRTPSTEPTASRVRPYSVRYPAEKQLHIAKLRRAMNEANDKGKAFECAAQIDIALALEGEGWASANHILLNDDGKAITEIDCETRDAIFEFTTASGCYYSNNSDGTKTRVIKDDKLRQVRALVNDARRNPFNKTIVFFAPFYEIQEHLDEFQHIGVLLPQTPTQLREIVRKSK